jgi:hypothetical protein
MNETWRPRIREVPALPARRPTRKPTAMDHIRARELLLRIERGEDEVTAFWSIASDPGIGFSRFRGVTERPPEMVLRRKMAALLARTVPQVIDAARDLALGKLAALSDDAVAAVRETVAGEVTDGRVARVRLDSARTILASIGICDGRSTLVATQVNIPGPGRTLDDLVGGD